MSSGPSPTSAPSSGPSCAPGSTRSRSRPSAPRPTTATTTSSGSTSSQGSDASRLAKLTPADVQAFLNREARVRPLPSPRPDAPRRPATRPGDRRAVGHGQPQRRQARRSAAGPEARDPAADARAGPPPHRESADDRSAGLWITALGTGLRQGELLGLRWEDVDLDAGRLRVRHTLARVDGKLVLLEPKTERSRRTVMLPAVVIEALRAHRTRQKMERLVAGSGGSTRAMSSRRRSGRRSRRLRSHGRSMRRSTAPSYRRAGSTTSVMRPRPSRCRRASRSRTSRTSWGTPRSC